MWTQGSVFAVHSRALNPLLQVDLHDWSSVLCLSRSSLLSFWLSVQIQHEPCDSLPSSLYSRVPFKVPAVPANAILVSKYRTWTFWWLGLSCCLMLRVFLSPLFFPSKDLILFCLFFLLSVIWPRPLPQPQVPSLSLYSSPLECMLYFCLQEHINFSHPSPKNTSKVWSSMAAMLSQICRL